MRINSINANIVVKFQTEKSLGSWTVQLNKPLDASAQSKRQLTGSYQSSSRLEIELISAISVLALLPTGNETTEVTINSTFILDRLAKEVHHLNQGETPVTNLEQTQFRELWRTLCYLNSRRNIVWLLPKPEGLSATPQEKRSISSSEDVTYITYTDGSCLGNPGRGGWGAFVEVWVQDKIRDSFDMSGSAEKTTNNRMELMGAIKVLEHLPSNSAVTVMTDSKYLFDGITGWITNWKTNYWKTASNKPVKNKDLWLRLDKVTANHRVSWKWVKGHHISEGNKRADKLATTAAEG